ncbi:aspartate aminotransferase family protein [Ancylobacter sp. 6x-1]|uniref:Aspartate aminotransferase family protein n=1 Tax=Ancylobacter crimeensis TaxID=2579147 RepID=A0ABT0DF68_9HYPH|nr:aspartate aminotransferase family protein [Ancylobacter crimeensis]MCK0198616.1 aspartate aminotransferase family protein [Ancylobacter crimeensis]
MLTNSLQSLDVAHHIHPITNLRRLERQGPIVIDRGQGIYVYDDEGREYIEAMAGLWSVGLGFGEQRLVDAATKQLEKLPYYHVFSQKAHAPSALLAAKLTELAPAGLEHVFFTNSGAEANDSVVKFVWYYNNAIGRPEKKKFLARDGGYHGITVAAGSLTGLQTNQKGFDLPLPFVRHLSRPHFYRAGLPGETEEAFTERLLKELEDTILAEGPETVAAFIGEPVMGAGGVLVPPKGYWAGVQEICRKYDVLVVADEVINGFGRLGTMFGCETLGIEPDILVCSKQITSSYQPLAAVLMKDFIYQAMADASEKLGVFGHGYTTGAHPVSTAVALENLAIIEERDLVARSKELGAYMHAGLAKFADHPHVGEIRGIGLIAAVELVADKATKAKFEPFGKVGLRFFDHAHEHGLIVRGIGDSIAFCPPMIITEAEIDEMLRRFKATLDDITAWIAAGMPDA